MLVVDNADKKKLKLLNTLDRVMNMLQLYAENSMSPSNQLVISYTNTDPLKFDSDLESIKTEELDCETVRGHDTIQMFNRFTSRENQIKGPCAYTVYASKTRGELLKIAFQFDAKFAQFELQSAFMDDSSITVDELIKLIDKRDIRNRFKLCFLESVELFETTKLLTLQLVMDSFKDKYHGIFYARLNLRQSAQICQ